MWVNQELIVTEIVTTLFDSCISSKLKEKNLDLKLFWNKYYLI